MNVLTTIFELLYEVNASKTDTACAPSIPRERFPEAHRAYVPIPTIAFYVGGILRENVFGSQ